MLEQFHQSPISVLHPTKPKTKKFLGPRHLRRQVFGVTKDLHPIMLRFYVVRETLHTNRFSRVLWFGLNTRLKCGTGEIVLHFLSGLSAFAKDYSIKKMKKMAP